MILSHTVCDKIPACSALRRQLATDDARSVTLEIAENVGIGKLADSHKFGDFVAHGRSV
jgi:hypothetical protein